MRSVATSLAALLLIVASCGDDATEAATSTHTDPADDCRFSFGEGSTACGPGTDIVIMTVDPSGPIVLTVEFSDPPQFDQDIQWLVEFAVSDLACGLTNTESTDIGFMPTETLGPYGYRTLTNEDAPPDACDGSLEGSTATLIFNIQPPTGPWAIIGGTQQVELANLDDLGSSDDMAVEGTPLLGGNSTG